RSGPPACASPSRPARARRPPPSACGHPTRSIVQSSGPSTCLPLPAQAEELSIRVCSECSRQQCGVPQAPTSYSGADSQYQSSPTLAAFAEGASVPPFSSGVGGPKAHDYSVTDLASVAWFCALCQAGLHLQDVPFARES